MDRTDSYTVSYLVHREYQVGETNPRLFGSFLEHLGRAIYGGIHEPGHPTADSKGFRRDVVDLVRQLDVPVVRYPGGNFVSGYRWEDGVGPIESRPSRLELAWRTIEPNHFGLNEFVDWCRIVNTEPYMAVNLGTRGPDEARALVEYSNHPGGTELSDLRRAHGHEKPHDIRLWCLGNEMDGGWQICAKTAEEYARIAEETAKMMKWVDPDIELVACGSSAYIMPTYPDWERIVLDRTYEHVEYISLHNYVGNRENDNAGYLAKPTLMDDYIRSVLATCDHVKARKRSNKTINLAFDEWNVWSHKNDGMTEENRWRTAPHQLEEIYTMADALVVAGMYLSLLRHCDRVHIACQAQLVNVIAPIMTCNGGGAWKQTIFHPMEAVSRHGRGVVLRGVATMPEVEHPQVGPHQPCDLLAVHNPGDDGVTLFAINRSLEKAALLTPRLEGYTGYRFVEHTVLQHADLEATNSEEAPDNVHPRSVPIQQSDVNALEVILPPASFHVMRFLPTGK